MSDYKREQQIIRAVSERAFNDGREYERKTLYALITEIRYIQAKYVSSPRAACSQTDAINDVVTKVEQRLKEVTDE